MVWAVVPFKGVDRSKSRLASHLSSDGRRRLSRAMLEDVLDSLADCTTLDGVLLVSACRTARALAGVRGVAFYPDQGDDLSRAVGDASAYLKTAHGVETTFFVPGDVPLVTPQDVESAIRGHREVTIVPDSRHMGTNAMLSTPPNAFPLRFNGRSFAVHLQLARQGGIQPRVLELPNLALDVDSFEDALRVAALAPGSRTARAMRSSSSTDSTLRQSFAGVPLDEEPCPQ